MIKNIISHFGNDFINSDKEITSKEVSKIA